MVTLLPYRPVEAWNHYQNIQKGVILLTLTTGEGIHYSVARNAFCRALLYGLKEAVGAKLRKQA